MNADDMIIPRWLREHEGVGVYEAYVWAYLDMKQGRNAFAWPNVGTVAQDLRLGTNTVKRSIGALERARLLRVERVNGRGNRYTVARPTGGSEVTRPSQGSVAEVTRPSQGSVAEVTQPSEGRHPALRGPAPSPHRAGTQPSQGSVTLPSNPSKEPFQGTTRRPPAPAKPEAPSVASQIAQLEAALDAELCADAREACALTRRNGKMADTLWLTTLRQLSTYPPTVANEAMRTFSERHADGEKSERYLIGIARGLAKSGRPGVASGRQGARIPAPPNSAHAEPDDPDDFDFSGSRRRRVQGPNGPRVLAHERILA